MIKISANIASNMVHRPGMSVDLDMCVGARAGFDCRLCKDACVKGIAGSEVGINSLDRSNEYCSRCGACASECPTGAIELPEDMYYHKLLRVSTQLQRIASEQEPEEPDHVVVSCSTPEDDERQGAFGICVSWLDEAAIVHLLSVAGTNVLISSGSCTDESLPESKACIARLMRHVEAVNHLMALIGVKHRAMFASSATSEARLGNGYGDLVDRNSAIKEVLRQGLTFLAGSRNPEAKSGTADSARPQGSGRRLVATLAVERLLKDAADLSSERPSGRADSPAGPLSRKGPKVDKDRCTACGVCALLCPTGALRTRQAESKGLPEWRLSFDVLRCVGCAVCVSGCQTTGAIALTDRGLSGIWRQKGIILARRNSLACDDCGETYPVSGAAVGSRPPSRQCMSCKLRRTKLASFY